jgi:hypothetical protein
MAPPEGALTQNANEPGNATEKIAFGENLDTKSTLY